MADWNALNLLLYGGPHEVMPGLDQTYMAEKAANWLASPLLTNDERDRIRRVWLAGERLPGYQPTHRRYGELEAIGAGR